MKFRVTVFQVTGGDVRVNLSRRDRRVAKQLLDSAQIGAPIQHVRSRGMPQLMRMNAAQASPKPRLANNSVDRLSVERKV